MFPLAATMSSPVGVSQPYPVHKDIEKLTQSLMALSELPRQAATMLLDHFESEDAKSELQIIACNLRAYKSSKTNSKKDVVIKNPKAVVVMHDFNLQGKLFPSTYLYLVNNLTVKLVMVKEHDLVQQIYDWLKTCLYGCARSSLYNNTACMKLDGEYKS